MCDYCNGKKFSENGEFDNIYFEIYGKHLRVNGTLLGIHLGEI